jgi:hypothetical protein
MGSGDIRRILSGTDHPAGMMSGCRSPPYGRGMWWGIGGGLGILYLVLMIVLGISCLRKGHWVMFIVGFVIPLFWIIGAIIPPVRR